MEREDLRRAAAIQAPGKSEICVDGAGGSAPAAIQAPDEPIGKGSPRQEDDGSHGCEIVAEYSGPDLPEVIWYHIHSLVPMRDAARAACVSHAFLRSWRCRPNLTFSLRTLGMNNNVCGDDERARNFTTKVDNILRKHSGIGVKTLEIDFSHQTAEACDLDNWLQVAVTPAIEELRLVLFPESDGNYYNFPWSLLADGNGNSIRYLNLSRCAFCPTVGLSLKSMTQLSLWHVRITEDQLACVIHNSFALRWMRLGRCNELICLKVPHLLQQLTLLEVLYCTKLQVVESKAPNLSNFRFRGDRRVQLSLTALPLKKLLMSYSGAICYGRADVPPSLPYVESLSLHSRIEIFNTPMLPSKFLHLKDLTIHLGVADYFYLISYFDASPSLETFFLNAEKKMEHESIVGDTSHLRQMPGHRHDNLKTVKIIGFSSAKSLVELTCHIVENRTTLECLTLDTTQRHSRASCSDLLVESRKGLLAIRTYVEPKVPSRVNLTIVEPCRRCREPEL